MGGEGERLADPRTARTTSGHSRDVALPQLPVRRPLAERADVIIDLTAVSPAPPVGLAQLDGVISWLALDD
ncbi:hypothetical protein GCM10027446_16050 [Angustibacter peucedani]